MKLLITVILWILQMSDIYNPQNFTTKDKNFFHFYWLIWYECQSAYVIMNFLSCVIVGGVVVSIVIVVCGQSSWPQVYSYKLDILHTQAYIPLETGHEIFSQYDLYF